MPKIPDSFQNKEKKGDNSRDYLMHEKRFNDFLFLVGPRRLEGLYNDPVHNMPFFCQHLKMCPENQVHPDTAENTFDGNVPQMRGFRRDN
jgi:hypothetical protein